MTSILNCLFMGRYAGYVWSAYGIVLVVLAVNALFCHQHHYRIINQLRQWFRKTSVTHEPNSKT